MSKRDTDPPREIVEKFSVRWYLQELQELFVIAADAKRNSEPEFDQIARLLQDLANNFLQPAHIQQHHDDHLIDAYRAKVAGLQPGTEEFFSTVEIGRWLRVCQEAIAQGRSPEQISRLITPLIEAKMAEFGLHQPKAPMAPLPPPVPATPTDRTIRPVARSIAIPVRPDRIMPPKPDLPAGTIEAVTVDEAERILASSEIHGDEFNRRRLTVDTLRAENLGPRYKTTIDGKTIWFSSAAYEVFDRLAVIAYVEQNLGQYTARTYYRSNSHGIWKYLPRYSGYEAHVNHFNKGFGQESISLPWQSQKALAEVSRNCIRVSDPKLTFVGTARTTDNYNANDTYLAGVNRRGDHLSGVGHTQPTHGGKNSPERVLISHPEQRPNFQQRVATWNYTTDIYGAVTAEVYASQDQTLQFVFCRDARNRVWIASVENVTSAPGPTGLRGDWVDAKDLTTPAFDYNDEAEGYGNNGLRAGRYYVDMYQNYISKMPVIQEYLRCFGIPLPTSPTPQPVLRPVPPAPKSNLGRIGAVAVAVGGAMYGGYKLDAAARLEHIKQQYDHVPPALREHLVGVPDDWDIRPEFQPHADWVLQDNGTYLWGERTLLAEPDGSALYIPADTQYNKAFMLPANARGNIDWRGARFPVQAIRDLELSLAPSGLWQDPEGIQYAVLDGGHLLSVSANGSSTHFLPFNESLDAAAWRPLAELATYYTASIDLSQIDTSIPAGFVDVAAEPSLQTIQIDISYINYNNSAAGVPIYPPDYKCQIPERSVADLAAVEAELSAQGYHLTIGDAKRPLIVQAFLREVLGKWASKPSPSAPHVAGLALDVGLLDATYIPVFESGYKPLLRDETGSKSLQSPADQGQALAQGWSAEEYRLWRTMADAFEAHGYQFIKSERWHVEYTK